MSKRILDYLDQEKEKFVAIVDQYTSDKISQYGKLTKDYAELLGYIKPYLLRAGKWHRPALGVMTYKMFGGKNLDCARQAILSSEVIHRFLLIHDDIIDRDLTRHGSPTIEKIYQDRFKGKFGDRVDAIYSKGNAIVAGDVVYTMGYSLILESDLNDETKVAMLKGLSQMIMETAAGWQLQNEQNYLNLDEVSEAEYYQGMRLVSTQYSVVWPLRLGQIAAGKLNPKDWDKNIEKYGSHTGDAFQITDDILGIFGEIEKTGKPAGNDFREGKKTYLVLKAYQMGNDKQRKFIRDNLGTEIDSEKLNQIRKIMIETGSLEYSQKMADEHVRKALDALEQLEIKSEEAELLAELARFLGRRSF